MVKVKSVLAALAPGIWDFCIPEDKTLEFCQRYCCCSNESPGGGMTGGRSLLVGFQLLSWRRSISLDWRLNLWQPQCMASGERRWGGTFDTFKNCLLERGVKVLCRLAQWLTILCAHQLSMVDHIRALHNLGYIIIKTPYLRLMGGRPAWRAQSTNRVKTWCGPLSNNTDLVKANHHSPGQVLHYELVLILAWTVVTI